MSEIQPYGGGDIMPLTRRRTRRELARLQSEFIIESAAVEKAKRLTEQKFEAVGEIGRGAQNEVAMLTQFEAAMIKAVPLAANRLEMIGEITTLGLARCVSDGIDKVRHA
jgi:hypothetical protein